VLGEPIVSALGLKLADLDEKPVDEIYSHPQVIALYDYRSISGDLIYQVERMQPKGFRQRRPDGVGGWIYNLEGVNRIPYRLPEFVKAVAEHREVYVVEGEKDADHLHELGLVATCNSGGAGKWHKSFSSYFKDAKVVILPDNDEVGKSHAEAIAANLAPVAKEIYVVLLPDLPDKGDVSDWLAKGHNTVDLADLVAKTQPWKLAPGQDSPAPDKPVLVITRADRITPTRPTWWWNGWLAQGTMELLIGRQGSGKTTFTAWLAAQLSTGTPMPGDIKKYAPIHVGILSGDESSNRIVARLEAAGADCSMVSILLDVEFRNDQGRVIHRPWILPDDLGILEDRIVSDNLGVVIIDGLGYMVSGDSHNYAVIGSALSGLADIAERTSASILGITHPPKGASDPVTAAIGSTAWTAIPRITWVLGRDPSQPDMRVVCVGKTNFKEPATGLSFTISDNKEHEVGFVTDIRASTVAAGDLVSVPLDAEIYSERQEAIEWLRNVLESAGGSLAVKELNRLAREYGIADITLKRVRRDLGVIAEQHYDQDGKIRGWVICLPDTKTTQIFATERGLATLQNIEHNSRSEDEPLVLTRTFTQNGGSGAHSLKDEPLVLTRTFTQNGGSGAHSLKDEPLVDDDTF
jgi:hypothetical protein